MQNVRLLMKDADNLLSFTEFKERFYVKTNFLAYHGVVSCIRLLIKEYHRKQKCKKTEMLAIFMKLHKSFQTQ